MQYDPDIIRVSQDWLLVVFAFYFSSMVALKISLGFFFLRITHERWQRYTIYAAVTLATLTGLPYMLFVILHCGAPINGLLFLLRQKANVCVSRQLLLYLTYAHGVINSVTDWVFAILSAVLVWGMTMRWKEKLIVGFVLMLGTLYVPACF